MRSHTRFRAVTSKRVNTRSAVRSPGRTRSGMSGWVRSLPVSVLIITSSPVPYWPAARIAFASWVVTLWRFSASAIALLALSFGDTNSRQVMNWSSTGIDTAWRAAHDSTSKISSGVW